MEKVIYLTNGSAALSESYQQVESKQRGFR